MARSVAQKPFSVRMSEGTLARLDRGARRRGEAKARTAERLIDEGLRMEDHPGIVFRDGPTGRRAALAGGPDVWEVVQTLRETGLSGEQAVAATAEWGNLSHAQVNVAVRYYADFPEEVDERIAYNRDEADRQYAAWERVGIRLLDREAREERIAVSYRRAYAAPLAEDEAQMLEVAAALAGEALV